MACSASFTLRVTTVVVPCTISFSEQIISAQSGQPWSNGMVYTVGSPAETSWRATGTKKTGEPAGSPNNANVQLPTMAPVAPGQNTMVSGTAPVVTQETDYTIQVQMPDPS